MASPLADLDELILKCRDERAQKYIKEAVSCYKSGAFRSAIVSTWIAVAFDIIEKLKELALTGDKEADKQLEDLERVRRSADVAGALKFEKEILLVARDKLELISHIEFIDLTRLQEDRNRCAHPSMTAEGDIFNPPAELARVHIRTVVDSLLQYPPAQGKYALDRLLQEVSSDYFPDTVDKALTALRRSALSKPRESLVRNFVIVLLKKLVCEVEDYKERSRVACALKAVEEMHREVSVHTIRQKLSDLLRTLDDAKLHRVVHLVRSYPIFWDYVEADLQQKICTFVEVLPTQHFEDLESFLNYPPLAECAKKRARFATLKELQEMLPFDVHPVLLDKIIEFYTASKSYDQANSRASLITLYATDFSSNQIELILKDSSANDQITYSFSFKGVLNALRRNKNVAFNFDETLHENGLDDYLDKDLQ